MTDESYLNAFVIFSAMMHAMFMKLLLVFAMLFAAGCADQKSSGSSTADFSAMIISDLHFTLAQSGTDLIVPLVSHSEMLMQTIVNEVCAVHPDVFIMTGDNTNSGNIEDEQALVPFLKQIEDAGITVVMTTGNHDWNNSDPGTYEAVYFPILEMDGRDTDSLSYAVCTNGVTLLSMDDNSASEGDGGCFSRSTMKWLKKQLRQAEKSGNQILFLSHHSVLSDEGNDHSDYWIQNRNLKSLLEKHHVSLCLTGHQHSPSILSDGSLYEIISAMPADGSHLIGTLTIKKDSYGYHADPIDFETFGPEGMEQIVKEADLKEQRQQMQVFKDILERKNLTEEQQNGCLSLLEEFFSWYKNGIISDHVDDFQNNAYSSILLDALKDDNYGPWMEQILSDPPLPALHLSFNADQLR